MARRKKIFIYIENEYLANILKRDLSDKTYIVHIGTTLGEIKTFKPNVILYNKDVDKIQKYATKKTYMIYLSNPEVFFGINELGFQSFEPPNSSTKNGVLNIELEKISALNPNSLIIRTDKILNNDYLESIKTKIFSGTGLDSKAQFYPMKAEDVVFVFDTLLSLETKGIVHLRGSERTSEFRIGMIVYDVLKTKEPVNSYIPTQTNTNVKLAGIILPTVVRETVIKLLGEKNV
jgi:hypothetical protein